MWRLIGVVLMRFAIKTIIERARVQALNLALALIERAKAAINSGVNYQYAGSPFQGLPLGISPLELGYQLFLL